MFTVKLSKIESLHQNLRTDEVVGETSQLPVIGERFRMIAKSLTPDMSLRLIDTSPVQSIEDQAGVLVVKTLNSLYTVEVLNETLHLALS